MEEGKMNGVGVADRGGGDADILDQDKDLSFEQIFIKIKPKKAPESDGLASVASQTSPTKDSTILEERRVKVSGKLGKGGKPGKPKLKKDYQKKMASLMTNSEKDNLVQVLESTIQMRHPTSLSEIGRSIGPMIVKHTKYRNGIGKCCANNKSAKSAVAAVIQTEGSSVRQIVKSKAGQSKSGLDCTFKEEFEDQLVELDDGLQVLISGLPFKPVTPFYEMQEEHRTPVIAPNEIDYADSCIQDEIKMLKSDAAVPEDCLVEYKDVPSRSSSSAETLTLVGYRQKDAEYEADAESKTKNNLKSCPICKLPASFTCKGCLCIAYCSKEHQKEDWKAHRVHCLLIETAESPTLGRHLVAKAAIKAGELIFKEWPLISAPTQGDSLILSLNFDPRGFEGLDDEGILKEIGAVSKEQLIQLSGDKEPYNSYCLGCCLEIHEDWSAIGGKCVQCGWPLCAAQCPRLEDHKLECNHFIKHDITFESIVKDWVITPRVWLILRCILLRTEHPDLLENLLTMQSHLEEKEEVEKIEGRNIPDIYIALLIKKAFKLEDVPVKLILTLIGIVDCNAFYSARLIQFSKDDMRFRYLKRVVCLYEKASLLSHSCIPNAVIVGMADPPRMELIASTGIKKGDVIWIDYDYSQIQRPKFDRRMFLKKQYHFDCLCPLCLDPTEGGTYFNALVCLRCKIKGRDGLFLPLEPLSETPNWQCTRCKTIRNDQSVLHVLKEVSGQIYVTPIEETKALVESLVGTVLHENHTLILQAERDVMKILHGYVRESPASLHNSDLTYLLALYEKKIAIMEKIIPKMCRDSVNAKLDLMETLSIQGDRAESVQQLNAILDRMQQIYDDILSLFVNSEVQNTFHGFVLLALRVLRNILKHVNDLRRKFLFRTLSNNLTQSFKLQR